jgi:hypothetical protein
MNRIGSKSAMVAALALLFSAGLAPAEERQKPVVRVVPPTPTATKPPLQLAKPPAWRFGPPNAQLTLKPGVLGALKVQAVKKEISCGVFVWPPNPSPYAMSQQLYWVNSTGQPLPPGTHIQWEVEGTPASCCKGTTGATSQVWQPNPPTPVYFTSATPELAPPQPWSRPCKAWAILP